MKIFDKTLTKLESALDARLLRQGVLAGNLANIDTPGFKPREVNFEAALHAAEAGRNEQMRVGQSPSPQMPLETAPLTPVGAAPASIAPIVLGSGVGVADAQLGGSPSIDGNAVDLDRTMVAMAENALQYGASARAAGKKLAILRYVASDGNG